MTVFALPPSLIPVRQRWQEERQDIEFRSVFGSQILQPVPPVWATELEFEDRADWRAGDIKALWMQLAGGNQLEAYDMARPAPLGTYRGTLTLAADVAQGATSMQLVRANDNLLSGSEAFGGSSWLKTRASVSDNVATAPDGQLTADKLVEDATASSTHYTYANNVAVVAGSPYSFAVSLKGAGRNFAVIELCEGISGANGAAVGIDLVNGVIGTPFARGTGSAVRAAIAPDGQGYYRVEIGCIPGSAATVVDCIVYTATSIISSSYPSVSGDGSSGVFVWGGKLNAGSSSTQYGHNLTLLAGDLLGIGSGTKQQVVMVTQDATSTGQGNITVNFEHPLRNAFSAGQAVTWDKPKALFRLRQNRPGWDYERSRAKGVKLDLVESVYA